MSQQSLTFLSQSATQLYKQPKPHGGSAQFKPGVSGTMVLKNRTARDTLRIMQEDKENIAHAAATRPMRLCEYHYATARESEQTRIRLGVLDLPPKPIASIPGYSGFIPRKDAANLIGETYKKGNLLSAELFAQEQEMKRKSIANIKGPDPKLTTPDTYSM